MIKRRKDKRNRVLHDGEYQRSDGRYEYRYYDIRGNAKTVYSWKLVDTDPLPAGARKCKPLREMEADINEKLVYSIDIDASKRTLDECYNEYIKTRLDLKRGSREVYDTAYRKHVKECLGHMRIGKIMYSQIRSFYIELLYKNKLKRSTVTVINAVLDGVFTMQMRNLAIKVNPVDGVLSEILHNDDFYQETREALTLDQQTKLVEFYTTREKYFEWIPMLTVLLGTGIRIGECIALTWNDINWQSNEIIIDHKIMDSTENGKKIRYIEPPKSKSSIRKIPMFSEVRGVLEKEYEKQKTTGFCPEIIDSYSGFIFFTNRKKVISRSTVKHRFDSIVSDYNKLEEETAKQENRKPELMPAITPHTLRHCFCSRMVEAGTEIKVLQEIMGHSNYQTTMDIYTQISPSIKLNAVQMAEGKFKII